MLKMPNNIKKILRSWMMNEANMWAKGYGKDDVKVRVQVKYDKEAMANIIKINCNDNEVVYDEVLYYDEEIEDLIFGYDVNEVVIKVVKND